MKLIFLTIYINKREYFLIKYLKVTKHIISLYWETSERYFMTHLIITIDNTSNNNSNSNNTSTVMFPLSGRFIYMPLSLQQCCCFKR